MFTWKINVLMLVPETRKVGGKPRKTAGSAARRRYGYFFFVAFFFVAFFVVVFAPHRDPHAISHHPFLRSDPMHSIVPGVKLSHAGSALFGKTLTCKSPVSRLLIEPENRSFTDDS